MALLDDLKAQLAEALEAEHAIATSRKAKDVSIDGQRVAYTEANLADLQKHITNLRTRITAAGGSCADGGARRTVRRVFIG